MAATKKPVKKPHSLIIKPGSKLWEIIDGVRDACGTTSTEGKHRKAQSGTVLEGLLSAVVEAADASTMNKVLDAAVAQKRKDDKRGEYIAAVVDARNAAAFSSLPSDPAELKKLRDAIDAKMSQSGNK